ncbi:MAG: SUF system NifU family Fe-S cluster assembly protein [Ignavibacteriae bacterium]|nr:MAG: SUF system NifU family Fe-S cluster assembly protein [Ignavibacteriota bacterium]
MSDLNLKALYQEIILDHNRNPRNFKKMDDASCSVDGYNPLCGDHYTIFLKLDHDIIREISFQGSGCAISKASASVMSTVLKGKTRAEAEEWFEKFHHLVRGESNSGGSMDELGKLAAFAGVSEFPARVKCAILPWHTMKNALEEKKETVSTE